MKFANPGWLWALLALPLLYWAVVLDEKRRQAQFGKFAEKGLWRRLAPEIDPKARLRKAGLWVAAFGFALLAMARPQWGTHEETIKTTGLDIMVVLDVSNSMETEDVTPSRTKKARHLIRTLVEKVKGDRVGLVAFAAGSYVACPLTTDVDYVLETLAITGPRSMLNQGTDIGLALDTARKALDRGAEETGAKSAQEPESEASRVVILISDGEDQEQGATDAAKLLKEQGTKLYVLGVGTEKGGPIPLRDETGNLLTYKKDRKGQPIVSTFNPSALMKVAQAGGGKYWNITAGEGEVDEMLQDMGALDRGEYAERKYVVYEDRFQIPLAIAALLLLIELSLPARKILALLLVFVWAGESQAASVLAGQPSLESYLENRKGLQSFKDGRVDQAKREFGTAQALNPELPELQFNQGAVQMAQEDADGAIQSFSEAYKGAQARGDEALAAQSLYNLGAAQAKKGDTPGAVKSYLSTMESAKALKDEKLEEDARRNLQLLIQEQQKQKQQKKDQENKDKKDQENQQKQDQQKQNGGQGSGKDQKEQQGNQKNQDGQNQKSENEPKQYEDPSKGRKRKFESQKLTKEDADRVMSELSNRERDLQGRIKKQNGTPQQGSNGKDW